MTPELWQRLKPLYQAAIERPNEQRARFIAEACGNDEELRQELTALLNAGDQPTASGDFPIVNLERLLATTSTSFSVGELVLGRFRIVRLLGSGGMGNVYEASDVELGRIALKTIRSDIADSPEMLTRFKKEVHLARKVGGPYVCRVYELFVVPGAREKTSSLFLTMEFLDGITLADKIRESGALPWREAQVIATQMCAGLQTIHQAGIIHRDLKSRNIMLASRNGTGCAVLMDFGLARELTTPASETATSLTGPGAITGTPAYMAPEQFAGTEVSPATDLYALGIVLYELVTGKHPFASSTPVGAAVLRGRRPQPASSIQPGIPRQCDEVINKCLEYEARNRYQSAEEVSNALRARPLSARRLIEQHRVLLRSWSLRAIVSVVVLLTAALGIFWFRTHRYHVPSIEVQRWYDTGTTALREGTYLKATRALQVAVDRDKGFALGHARLADAWSELDFAGRAQKEMLLASAPESERNLPALDRMYIEAVRSTLTHDYATAVKQYQAILDALPAQEKAYGSIDLGRAQEKAGSLNEAVKDYETATRLDKDSPAAFLRLGVLRSRQQDAPGGEAAFKQAETLYRESSNTEGLAEIAYQRGYADNVRGDSEHAKANLQTSLDLARQIPSVQLEIRALTQMSSVEYFGGNINEAIRYANQAIAFARENELDYWSGDGLIRLGNAYLSSDDLDRAEPPLQAALRLAVQDQQPRLEANARFSLASVRNKQGKWDESVQYARAALDYYKGIGMVGQATLASILIIRAQRNKGDLAAALQSAEELWDVSRKSDSAALTETSEELMGDILNSLERYPESLSHFEEALRIARAIHESEPYQALHCADALWPLGRYSEAQNMLDLAQRGNGKNAEIASQAELVETKILLSKRRMAEVIFSVDREFVPRLSHAVPDDLQQLRLLRARAEVSLGEIKKAADDVTELTAWAQKAGDNEAAHSIKLVQAEIDRKAGSPGLAQPLVDSDCNYFAISGKKESQWKSLLEQARVYRSLGESQKSTASAQLALDILREFKDTWPPLDYESYTTRPDNEAARKELMSYERH
jgi:tetratricopeptide (TPR) repeat protein